MMKKLYTYYTSLLLLLYYSYFFMSSYITLQHIIIVGVEGMDLLDLVQQVHHQALLELFAPLAARETMQRVHGIYLRPKKSKGNAKSNGTKCLCVNMAQRATVESLVFTGTKRCLKIM